MNCVHGRLVISWQRDAGRVWGDRYKYQRDLTTWWGLVGRNDSVVDAVTRATRNTGAYTLVWDVDQDGHAVAPGTYAFWIEVAYQNGPHSTRSVRLTCGPAKATGTISPTQAFAGGKVECAEAH